MKLHRLRAAGGHLIPSGALDFACLSPTPATWLRLRAGEATALGWQGECVDCNEHLVAKLLEALECADESEIEELVDEFEAFSA